MSVFNEVYAKSNEQFDALLLRRLDRVKNQDNRKLLDRHLDLKSHQVERSTIGAHAEILAFWFTHLGIKAALDADENDFRAYFRRRRDLAGNTNYHHYVVIRGFYRDQTGEDKPKQLGKFKIPRPEVEALTPSDLVSEDDLVRLFKVCRDEMERAVLAVFHGVGFRNGELRALDTNSVVSRDSEMFLCLPKYAKGLKTGPRDCLVFAPTDHYVKQWMAVHEHAAPGKTPLFYYKKKNGKLARIDANWMTHFFKRLNDTGGLEKPIWPHLFRHSAATNMAKRNVHPLTMCEYFGWESDSEMPAYYSHLAPDNHLNNLRAAHGVKPVAPKPVGLKMLTCNNCKFGNGPTDMFCAKCNRALTPEAIKEMQDRQQESINRLVATQVKEALTAAGVPSFNLI